MSGIVMLRRFGAALLIASFALMGAAVAPAYATTKFTNAVLLNGWRYGGAHDAQPGYAIDLLGVVHLRGSLTHGSPGPEAFALPAALRPSHTMWITVDEGGPAAGVEVSNTGSVSFTGFDLTPSSVLSLDGISFAAHTSHLTFSKAPLMNAWTPATFGNAQPGYAIDQFGIVHLRGGLAGTGSGTAALTLPPALRPPHDLWLPIYTGPMSEGSLTISSGGQVTPIGTQTSNFASLDGISFVAGTSKLKFTNPALKNGWRYGGYATAHPGYAIDPLGVVHLRGSVAGGPVDSTAFLLPKALCPTHLPAFPTYAQGYTEDGIAIFPPGAPPFYTHTGCHVLAGFNGHENAREFTSLDGISFVAGQ